MKGTAMTMSNRYKSGLISLEEYVKGMYELGGRPWAYDAMYFHLDMETLSKASAMLDELQREADAAYLKHWLGI